MPDYTYTRQVKARQALGLCVAAGCENAVSAGQLRCAICRCRHAATQARRAASRRAAGLCVQCGQSGVGAFARCATHRATANAAERSRTAHRRAAGLCIFWGCCTRAAQAEHQFCRAHARQRAHAAALVREQYRTQGLCRRCGHSPPVEGYVNCQSCRDYQRQYRAQRKEAQA